MEPKHDLLVFNKKEVGIILILLALVSLFSFTLGLRMGKKLAGDHIDVVQREEPNLTAHAEGEEGDKHEEATKDDEEKTTKENEPSDHSLNVAVQNEADHQLNNELHEQNVKSGKKIPNALPAEKIGSAHAASSLNKATEGKYTLQVGSHRSLDEAKDQVSLLKSKGLDAFSMEVRIPNKGTWYRVGIGVYPSKDMADKAAAHMKKSKNLPSYIVQKVVE